MKVFDRCKNQTFTRSSVKLRKRFVNMFLQIKKKVKVLKISCVHKDLQPIDTGLNISLVNTTTDVSTNVLYLYLDILPETFPFTHEIVDGIHFINEMNKKKFKQTTCFS